MNTDPIDGQRDVLVPDEIGGASSIPCYALDGSLDRPAGRTDTERLALVQEYMEGVEPEIEIVLTRMYNATDDEPTVFVVRERGSMLPLGFGDTVNAALDAFCDYYEREFPIESAA
jgi:hypothetical protein